MQRAQRGRHIEFTDDTLILLHEVLREYVQRKYAYDLVCFGRHARRSTITRADALLCARHNADLLRVLCDEGATRIAPRGDTTPAAAPDAVEEEEDAGGLF